MQGLDRPREKPPAQEQWQAIGKQCEEQWKQSEMQARAYIGVTPDAGDGCVRGRYPTEPGRICLQLNHALRGALALEKQTRPKRRASDARMSLCTYCHAPLAPGTQAEFDLSPLFVGCADPHRVSTTFCRSIWSGQKRTTDLQLGQLTERSPVVSIRRLGCPPGKRAF